MTTRIFIWLLWFALCLHADEVDRIVNEEMRQQHIPGVSVGVMRDGRLIKATRLRLRKPGAERSGDLGHSLRDRIDQ